jgi:GNAT superfamily N-acetyltransferase
MISPIVNIEQASIAEATAVHIRIPEFDPDYITDKLKQLDILGMNPYVIIAKVGEAAAGYMIGYDKPGAPDTLDEHSMYIWLNGTIPQYRGRGVFKALLHSLFEEAVARGHKRVSVKSDVQRFPNMVSALIASGFELAERTGDSVRYQKHLQ